MKPVRIQMRRTKGWRKPPNTVYVGRPSRWGNPVPTHEPARDGHGDVIPGKKIEVRTPEQAVKEYSASVMPYTHEGPRNGMDDFLLSVAFIESVQYELRGKNLACWCPLDQPCHADVLLDIANAKTI